MPKSDALPTILPQVGSSNLRGLTLHQLFHRQEVNDRNMELLKRWVEFHRLGKKLKRAILLKRLELWLLSLVGR